MVWAEKRAAILPPGLFACFERDAFWGDRAQLPTTVKIIQALIGGRG